MGAYRDELVRAMTYLGERDDTVFLGQAVAVPGTAMFGTLEGVPMTKRIELPVEEDFQLGLSIGLAMQGAVPISIFPRLNFLLLATNQLVNHLNAMREMTRRIPPPVILRSSVGSERPLHPGPQHTGNLTEAIRKLVPELVVEELDSASRIFPAYDVAVNRRDGRSTLLVERGDDLVEK